MQPDHCTDIALTAQLELAQRAELLLLLFEKASPTEKTSPRSSQNLFDPPTCIDRLGKALTAGNGAIDGGATGAGQSSVNVGLALMPS